MRSTVLLLSISLFALLLVVGCGPTDSDVVARVDGEPIDLSLIDDYFQPQGTCDHDHTQQCQAQGDFIAEHLCRCPDTA